MEGVTIAANRQKLLLPSIVCLLGASFYLYEFVLQVSPGVITQELMRDLRVDGAGLGIISAFYFYAYTPMQIPAGMLYDRFGPRVLITLTLLICALGALFFARAETAALASLGRFFMGFGSAFSFIGALMLVARWFPAHYFAFVAGIVQFMSSIGAMMGETPLAKAVASVGWRHAFLWIAIAGIGLAVVIWAVVRDAPEEILSNKPRATGHGGLQRLGSVCNNRQMWWLALYSFCCWAPITVFAMLWGVPYLQSAYGLSTAVAATACGWAWLGVGIGSPLVGWWSDYIGQRCMPLTIACLIGVFSTLVLIYVPHLSLAAVSILLFLLGIAASGQSLSFAVVKDINHPGAVATAIGLNNMAVVAGGVLQPFVGWLLELNWGGTSIDGAHTYDVADYRIALFILPLCYLIATWVSGSRLQETHCQPQIDVDLHQF